MLCVPELKLEGFKFATYVGELMAQLALDRVLDFPLGQLSVSRFKSIRK